MNKLPGLTEHQIQTQVIGWLRAKGYYVERVNSGKYAVGEGTSRRMILGAEAGTPDLRAFKLGCVHHYDPHIELIYIEVKREGKQPTMLQNMKMDELRGYGAKCIVVHSIEELEEQI